MRSLSAVLAQLVIDEVPLTSVIRTEVVRYMADFGVRSIDAALAATAGLMGNLPIASFDEVFRRVDGLHLWNDRIHG